MKALLAIFTLLLATTLLAQDGENEPASLQNQFDDIKTKSNNYQIYKVVKTASLDEFWKSVKDTLKVDRTKVSALQKEMASLSAEVNNLNEQVSERDKKLEEQEYHIEHMEFFGLGLTKGSYILITWTLIFVLLIASVVLYFRFHAANRITTKARNEYQNLQTEFEEHRQRTRENETKLKRDLQTEINRVEELKEKINGGK